jgi:hypothetical protein
MRKASQIQILLHGESGSEKTNGVEASLLDLLTGGICNVKKGDVDMAFDLRSDPMHGVCADDEKVGACRLDPLGSFSQERSSFAPSSLMLQRFDFVKVNAVKNNLGRMESAKPLAHSFVDETIVRDSRFPTHATQQAYGFHRMTPLSSMTKTSISGKHRKDNTWYRLSFGRHMMDDFF